MIVVQPSGHNSGYANVHERLFHQGVERKRELEVEVSPLLDMLLVLFKVCVSYSKRKREQKLPWTLPSNHISKVIVIKSWQMANSSNDCLCCTKNKRHILHNGRPNWRRNSRSSQICRLLPLNLQLKSKSQ